MFTCTIMTWLLKIYIYMQQVSYEFFQSQSTNVFECYRSLVLLGSNGIILSTGIIFDALLCATCKEISFHPAALLSQRYSQCLKSVSFTCVDLKSMIETSLCVYMAKESVFFRKNLAGEIRFLKTPSSIMEKGFLMYMTFKIFGYYRKLTLTWLLMCM